MATLLEKWELANGDGISDDFRHRVEIAVTIAAIDVHAEDPGTPNHDNRITWAKETLRDVERMGEMMLPAVCANETIATAGESATDNDIQFTVNSLVDAYAPA